MNTTQAFATAFMTLVAAAIAPKAQAQVRPPLPQTKPTSPSLKLEEYIIGVRGVCRGERFVGNVEATPLPGSIERPFRLSPQPDGQYEVQYAAPPGASTDEKAILDKILRDEANKIINLLDAACGARLLQPHP
jgi:hypothetical protein